jgi:hypothetical protein
MLFSRTPNRSATYPQGYAYHRLGTTLLEGGTVYLNPSYYSGWRPVNVHVTRNSCAVLLRWLRTFSSTFFILDHSEQCTVAHAHEGILQIAHGNVTGCILGNAKVSICHTLLCNDSNTGWYNWSDCGSEYVSVVSEDEFGNDHEALLLAEKKKRLDIFNKITTLEDGKSRVRFVLSSLLLFSVYLFFPAALWP